MCTQASASNNGKAIQTEKAKTDPWKDCHSQSLALTSVLPGMGPFTVDDVSGIDHTPCVSAIRIRRKPMVIDSTQTLHRSTTVHRAGPASVSLSVAVQES